MKFITKIIKNDFINFAKYRILYMTIIVSGLFALAMGFFPNIDPLLFVYVSIFILPVITHSIVLFIEREENSVLPISLVETKPIKIISTKVFRNIDILL